MHHVAELRCGLSHRGGSDRKCRKLVAKYRDGDELESTGGPYRLASGEVATEFPNRLTAYPAHEIFDDPWRWGGRVREARGDPSGP